MATNIEQIFRSFVVTKFREIQEQQFGSGKLGNQHNGEINTSGQVNSSDDTIQSIESLQNDPLVQKIEQVLSEVLGTEPRYKSGDGDDNERNNSHAIKRGLSEDVQDEIPRKRSKKDKKHKDKKKKKKRKKEKKEKKYKKHAKETDDQQKECEDMQLSLSDLENSGSLLNAENDTDVHSGSTLNEVSPLINEKTVHENLNSSMLNNTFSSDTSKLDTSEEDSTLISIQEVSEAKLTNEKELEDDSYHPNVTVNICPEDKSLSDAICTVVERVSDINEVEQAKLMLETTDQENIPESSPYCIRVEPEHLETRLESTAMEVTCVNSVTEPVTSKNGKETVSTSFESTGYKLMTLPLESNAEAKDSVTTLGFLAMVVGKDFEATSEFLNTAKVFTERSPKHSSRKGDSVHELEKTVTMKDLHKPQQFGTERKDKETAAEAVHTVLEKDPEQDVVVQPKPHQEVSEFDVQKYNRTNLGTEILKDMKESCTLMIGLNESEKNAGYLPTQKDATDLQRAPLLENRTRIDSEEHLSIVGLEKTNVDVNSYFTEIDARSDGVTESENWKSAPESSKAKNLECIQEFEKAERINYLETSLETVIENRGNSKNIQHSLALFSVKVPENASQLKDMNVSETIQTEKIQNLESSKYVDLRNKENKNAEKLKNIPESLMLVNNLENSSSELQCIEEIKIVKETSQSDVEAHKKDFKTVLEPEERDVDAGSGSLQMIFANYSEHNLELYTETEGMIELKNSDAVLKSLHKSNADNVESPYAKEIKYVKSTESEAVTEVNNLQENLKPLQKHVKNVEPASKSIALPTVTYTETLEGTSNRTQSKTESHFVQEIEQKCFDSTVKKSQSSVDTTDLGLTSRRKEVIETNSSKIGESESLVKNQGPLCISKSLHEIDVISSEKSNPEFKGIAVVQDLKEPGKSLTAAIDPKDFLKLKNFVLVESKDDFPFGGTMKQFESVSESLEQNQEQLENTQTQIRKECLDSVLDFSVKCARTSSGIPFIDEFNIQEDKKLEEKIETTGLMEAPEPLNLSERDLIVLTSDSGIKVSGYGPETVYLTKTSSEAIPKSYEIQMKDSKTSESKTINVKDMNIDSESLLQAGVEIKEYIPECKSVVSDSVEFTAEMLPESKSITKLQNSNAVPRSEGLTYEHLKTPPASVCVIDTEDLEIPPKSTELGVTGKQGVPTFLSASVDSTDVSEESFEHNYRTDMKKVEASQKSINIEFISKEKMNDQPVQPSNDNDANVSKLFMSSHCGVRAHIIEERLSVANKESVSGITSESGTGLLKCSEVSETITGQEREKCDITLPEFMVDVQDLKESPNILDAQEKNLKASQKEKYAKSLYVLESRDEADVSQSGSKVEPKGLRATMSYERLSEIKDPVAIAMQIKKPELTSSESVSILEVTDTLKTPELKTPQIYLGVTGFKPSDTTAKSCPLKIIDSDSQIQHENILEVKNLESASEIKYGLGTFPFKISSESEKVTPDQLSKAISNILSSGNMENLEQILKYRHNQERKDLESAQFDTQVAKDLKGSLTYEEIIGISEMTTQVSKARDTGTNLSATVPETTEKCSDIFLESKTMSDVQTTNTNLELDNLIKKSPDISADINKSTSNSGLIDIIELKCNNASESVPMKELEDFETVVLDKSVIEIKNLQAVQTSGEKEQMDFQELSKSVLPLNIQNLERNSSLPQQKILETSLQPVKDFASVSECSSTKDIEQNLKSGFVAEGKAEESTVEHVVLMQDKSAEIIPQFTLEMKDSEATLESVDVANRKDLDVQTSSKEQTIIKPLCMTTEGKAEVNQLETIVLGDSGEAVKPVHLAEKKVIRVGECIEAKDSEIAIESEVLIKDTDLEVSLQDSSKYQDSDVTLNSSEIMKESEGSNLKEKKSEKISSKSKDKSKSGKKGKKSRSKSPSKSKKRKKKSRSRSTSRQVSRRARSRSKHDSSSKRKHSTSRHKSRSKSVDKKESSLRSRRRRSRTSDRLKSRSKSPDRRDTSIRSRRRRSRSSDHKSRSRSVEKRDSARRRRRLSRSSDNRRSRSRSVDRRETLTRSRRRRSRSSDHHKSRSRSSDKRETSLRTRRRRSQSSDRCRSRSKSFDRRDSSVRTRRRRSRSSDNPKSRSRSPDDKRELSVRRRGRRSRTPETRKSRSRSVDRREISGRGRRRRSRSSDNRKSRSRSVDRRDSSVRIRRRRSRSSDNRRSKSKSVDRRDSSVRMKRRRSVSSDRKSRSRSVDKRDTAARSKRRRSQSSDNHKSRSKSVENIETSGKSKRRSKSTDKSRTKSVEKRESILNSSHRRSKSSDRPRSKSKSRSKSSERKKDTDSVDGSRGKRSKYRSKSKSLEKTDGTESLEATLNNREKSPEQHKSKSRSRSKSVDKAGEKERLRRSRSKGSKSSESRSRRRRTVSRSRRNRSRSQSRSRTRSQSRSRRRRTRSRSISRQRSLSRKRHRRSRRNRSRSTERRRRRSDSRDSFRISLRLRSRSRTPVRLRCSRSTGRRRSTSKSPDHRRSRSSSRSPKRLTDLDKAQLLEIAKANAAAMCAKAGVPLPPSLMPVITPEKKEEKVTQKSAKETILELTEKCKKIAQSQEDDVIVNKPHVSDEEEEEHPFINHPFKLNEPKPIFFNLTTPTIKPTPPKNQVTLTKEFPVSSGSQHRKKEADSAYGEWVPVEKDKDEDKDDVFPNPANLEPVDISSALNERTIAQKRLTENTFDLEAMCLLNRAQERIDAWAELNSIPGHFTGSTGAQVLTSEQLSNSGPQAWVKKGQICLVAAFLPRSMPALLFTTLQHRGLGSVSQSCPC
uniref:Protein SON n=1 Tax=Laticauda laticaudata TaxID=8630 RepID=A0A8C5RA93_LATLA